jgi:alpha-beta hydrolase superfamily lysophospholipase
VKIILYIYIYVIDQHRYYGHSFPPGAWGKRGYFSSAQALADYAAIIIDIKENRSAQYSPVIVIGGSYGGSRWIRTITFCMNIIDEDFDSLILFLSMFVSAGFVVSAQVASHCPRSLGLISTNSLFR